MIPKQDPKIRKVYFVVLYHLETIKDSNAMLFSGYFIILEYVGDESIVIDFPHGNSHHC